MSTFTTDVLAGRFKQRLKGYTPEHDDHHSPSEILAFGGITWDSPTRDQLVRATACLLAAGDRMDRESKSDEAQITKSADRRKMSVDIADLLLAHASAPGCTCKCGWAADRSLAFLPGLDVLAQHREHVARQITSAVPQGEQPEDADGLTEPKAGDVAVVDTSANMTPNEVEPDTTASAGEKAWDDGYAACAGFMALENETRREDNPYRAARIARES